MGRCRAAGAWGWGSAPWAPRLTLASASRWGGKGPTGLRWGEGQAGRDLDAGEVRSFP